MKERDYGKFQIEHVRNFRACVEPERDRSASSESARLHSNFFFFFLFQMLF